MFIKVTQYWFNHEEDVDFPYDSSEVYVDVTKISAVNMGVSIFVPEGFVQIVLPGESFLIKVYEYERYIKPTMRFMDDQFRD